MGSLLRATFAAVASWSAAAAFGADAGGRDVSIAMFSTHEVHAVSVAAAGSGAWLASCGSCPHRPLTTSIHLPQVREIFAGGPVQVTDETTHTTRKAVGLWHLRANGSGSAIDVVLTIPSERYVMAVLGGEADALEPPQSLQALAVLARTYGLHGRHFHGRPGHLPAELCDSTQCQAMRLGSVPSSIEDAVRATAGETLWSGTSRAEVFFSQSCGGQTESAGSLWPTLARARYLKSHPDVYCLRRNKAMWHTEIGLPDLASIAHNEGWRLPIEINGVSVARRSSSGRALALRFHGSDGHDAVVAASALRFGVGRELGWNRIRSDWYEVRLRDGKLIFDGRGFGHGVGLCQNGATEMAAEGRNYREILSFYFPGTAIHIQDSDNGWQTITGASFTVHATKLLSQEQMKQWQTIWEEAQTRFKSGHKLQPQVVFTPTTEIFRQLTSMPGWATAATHGSTIVLQPAAILQSQGRQETKTLLHEMLHVLVEAEATDRAPLWLREGLTEVLAGETGRGSGSARVQEVDAGLHDVSSQAANEQAHRRAAMLVENLVERYGMAAVRGWLSSGVPSSVLASLPSPSTPNSARR